MTCRKKINRHVFGACVHSYIQMFNLPFHAYANNPRSLFGLITRLDKYSLFYKIMSTQINNLCEQNVETQKNMKRMIFYETDETNIKIQKVETVDRIKKKNHVLLLSYLGRDYYGMQRNPGMRTVEEELFKALLEANLLTNDDFENVHNIQYQRAARTDKGVSAVRQVVNLKLPVGANISDINRHLPNDIRVFGIKWVTRGFNSKNKCDARTYRYIIPTYAFAPEDSNIFRSSRQEDPDFEKRKEMLSVIDGKPFYDYRLPLDKLDKLKSTLKLLMGTHNFHNFTSKVRPLDPRAKRYIVSFDCDEVFVAHSREFAILKIKGQSFMLHQIRKMISIVVAIMRDIVTEDVLKEAFNSEEKFDIPRAPGLGLCLNYVHYDYYNTRYGEDGIHEKLEWTECEEQIQEFDKNYILKDVVDTELAEEITFNWLISLLEHSFLNRDVNDDVS